MSAKTFFVNNGQSNVGPFDMSTIASMVNRLEIKATDYLCVDVEKDEWVMICQHPEFVALAEQSAKPSLKPSMKATIPEPVEPSPNSLAIASMPTVGAVSSIDLTQAQWYVLKGKNRFGPFMYVEIIRMLQEKSVFEFDFVWCQGLEAWKRIAEVEVFGSEKIRHLLDHS